tara:strand:- start:949 stop:1311 length:363 start_codon:yes stop_codon:yes gene_type:complete
MKWQLKKLSTNEALSEPSALPINWGPIFGLHGFVEKLGDLSWLGTAYADQGWVSLSTEEERTLLMAYVEKLRAEAADILKNPSITLAEKEIVLQRLQDINQETLKIDFLENHNLPSSFSS